jgi:hypothetical protein
VSRQYLIHSQVRDQASELYARGGKFARAAGQVTHIINEITRGSSSPLHGIPQTNNGESRLDSCVKYDLSGFCRLVTVHEENKIILLFVGNHEEEDKWLKRNKGARFALKGKEIEIIPMPSHGGDPEILAETTYSPGKLFQQLSERHMDYVTEGFPRSTMRKIEELGSISGEDSIFSIYEEIQIHGKADLFFDVFTALMRGSKEDAIKRIDYEKGEYKKITEEPVVSGEQLYVIPDNDPAYAQLFEHFVKTADYKQWMLFMHPSQQEMVDIDFKSSSKLLGVSGSGKTCVLVKRAVRLADKYPDDQILVVTLNRSLANLIGELVEVVAGKDTVSRIHVKPFFAVCQKYLHKFKPDSDKLYDDVTWKSLEHIDEVWEEFYRCENNNKDAAVIHPVHDYLIAQHVNAQSYIREEFDWIRSAVSIDDRDRYLTIERAGRSIPLSNAYRSMLLDGLAAWERKMTAVGITDYLGLATELYKFKDMLSQEYRCALIDESQDFGTTELTILRKITNEGENDIFLCGDAAQRVSSKFQSFKDAGLTIHPVNSKKITKNYRNTKEILEAAYVVLSNNIPEGASRTEDFEVLDPDFSSRSGATPVIAFSACLEDELSSAISYAKQELKHNSGWKICIAICGFTSYEVQKYGLDIGICVLDNNTKIGESSLFLSDLEQTKGFEFDLMIIVNASHDAIPAKNSPEREYFRELTQFYVALTRAKNQLIVSCSINPSVFLRNTSDYFLESRWEDYLDGDVESFNCPKNVRDFREQVDFPSSVVFMSGSQFLCTEYAMGVPQLLIEKIRSLVSGNGLVRGKSFIEWRNLGSAYDSCRNDVKSRQAFGPEGFKLFSELCAQLDIGDEVKKYKKEDVYKGIFSIDTAS